MDKPDLKKIGWDMSSLVRTMFQNWNPFPDKAYCEKVGWKVNADGTVDTPGGFRVPTQELCKKVDEEVAELERLYKLPVS